jgi:hypothetical protein
MSIRINAINNDRHFISGDLSLLVLTTLLQRRRLFTPQQCYALKRPRCSIGRPDAADEFRKGVAPGIPNNAATVRWSPMDQ